MRRGRTTLIAHLGSPTSAVEAPLIHGRRSEPDDVDAVVVPVGVDLHLEMIPSSLDWSGVRTANPGELRSVAQLRG